MSVRVFAWTIYASMCGDDKGIYSPEIYSTDVSCECKEFVQLLGSAGKQAHERIDLCV